GPGGTRGLSSQTRPYHFPQFTGHSRLTVNGNPLIWETDWIAMPGARAPRPIVNVPVVFGGVEGDTARQISALRAAGNLVVLSAAPAAARGGRGRGAAPAAGGRSGGFCGATSRFSAQCGCGTRDLQD